jgi:uncharacterized protein (TIGR03083 family)
MTGPRTPSYAELVTAVRREGEALVAAARSGADAEVPTCGDWTISDLARHVWQVYANVTLYVSTRATSRPESLPEMPDGDPVELLARQLDDLVSALSDAEPDTPIWTWVFDAPEAAIFWARRMAHESAVHRFDAQNAHGIRQPVDTDLATDGDSWLLELASDGVKRSDVIESPQVTASGTSSALLLALYSRVPWTSLDVAGDADLLVQWTSALSF